MDNLIIVNRHNILPKEYVPHELVEDPITKIILTKETYDAFYRMNMAIMANGLSSLILISGYRSYDYQQKLFEAKINKLISQGFTKNKAVSLAATIVARPGTSEHQTGLAVDLTSVDFVNKDDPLIEEFARTDHGKWLDINAHKYGFILRYPKDKTKITHITYEPWHYRYIGSKHAKNIKLFNLCLEEYINYLNIKYE